MFANRCKPVGQPTTCNMYLFRESRSTWRKHQLRGITGSSDWNYSKCVNLRGFTWDFKSVEVATRNHAHIIQLLEYCTSDLTDDYSDLVGVQLVPFESSEIGTFGGRDTYYLSSLSECELLGQIDQSKNWHQKSFRLCKRFTPKVQKCQGNWPNEFELPSSCLSAST